MKPYTRIDFSANKPLCQSQGFGAGASTRKYKSRFWQAPLLALLTLLCLNCQSGKTQQPAQGSVFARQNLVAWCIVPFDVKNRGPVERAEMLQKLGISKLAYDWREKHIPSFDEEIETLKKYNIDLQAFWLYTGPNPETDKNLHIILDLLKRHQVKTQIWCMVGGIADMDKMSQQQLIEAHAKPIRYIAAKAAEIGCSVGLYNHGGWYGKPENQLQLIGYLNMPNIGIVYNFHHAEDDVERFPQFFPRIKPHLMAVTLSGLVKGPRAKVVPLGQGNAEQEMMRVMQQSGYRGPINLLNEDTAPDAEEGLTINMNGLKQLLQAMGDTQALRTYQ